MKFCWATLHVSDMERSISFYQELVKLPLTRRFAAGEGKEIAFLGEGETQLELVFNPACSEILLGEAISLGFQVDSLKDKLEEVAKKGIPIHSGPFEPNPQIKFFYVQDPDGLLIQFVEAK